MPWPAVSVHAVAVALVAADVAARALRLRVILAALGHPLRWSRLVATTLACDAASALTPYRLGGDAARVAGLARHGVPPQRSVAALLGEAVQNWPVILTLGLVLGVGFGGALAAGVERVVETVGLWLLVVPPILVGSAWLAARVLRRFRAHAGPAEPLRLRTIASTLPLTVVSIVARVLILPVLVMGQGSLTEVGPVALASFTLLHSQLVLPTPSGAGAIELGFAAGLGGTASTATLLLAWRFYTSAIAVLLGGPAALLMLRRRGVR